MFKTILFASVLAALLISAASAADQYVHGYTRKDGTYVQPYHRTAPDSTRNNNYSTQGNINPYTGQPGTKPGDYGYSGGYSNPYPPSQTYSSPYPQQPQQDDQESGDNPY